MKYNANTMSDRDAIEVVEQYLNDTYYFTNNDILYFS